MSWFYSKSARKIVTDDFNRADSATLGANWTDAYAETIAISSNQATGPASGFAVAFWNADTFANDQFSELKCVYVGAATELSVRSSGAGGQQGFYAAFDGSVVVFYQAIAGVESGTLASGTAVLTGNEVLRLEAVGTSYTAYVNGIGVLSFSDASLTSGSAGLNLYSSLTPNLPIVDDWRGGDL